MQASLTVLGGAQASHNNSVSLSSEMEYFRSRLAADVTMEWLRQEKEHGRKVIGLMCGGGPAEIVIASGAVPVRLFGVWEEARASRLRWPRDACPLAVSAFTGAEALVREGLLDAVVVPGTCDWERKLGSLLAEAATVLTLQEPVSGDARFIHADLRNLACAVGLITDLPVVPRNLSFACAEIARAEEALVALSRLRQDPQCGLSGADALAVEQSFLRDDLARWTEHCRSLVRVVQEKLAARGEISGRSAARIVMVGSPAIWKEESIVHLIEEAGGMVVCDDFYSRPNILHDPEASTGSDGTGFAALAARWRRSAYCSLAGSEDEEVMHRAIDEFSAEGVVGHVYRSCARLQIRMPAFLRETEEKGIRSIILETDGDSDQRGRLLARIEPFIEILVARRRGDT